MDVDAPMDAGQDPEFDPLVAEASLAREDGRLATLRGYSVLDSEHEAQFDDLAAVAAAVCGTPIAAISLVDDHRQWFKASVGLGVRETPRDQAFCAHALQNPDAPLVVTDATTDVRFRDNPLVVGQPGIRAYAGAPLVAPDGNVIGTICAIDTHAREYTAEQLATLSTISRQVVELLEARKVALRLQRELSEEQLSNSARTALIAMSRPLLDAVGQAGSVDLHGLVTEFARETLRAFGWWAAQAWWREGDLLRPFSWILPPGAPASMAELVKASLVPVPDEALTATFPTPTLESVSSMTWDPNSGVIEAAGGRFVVLLDIPGLGEPTVRLVFVVPTRQALSAQNLNSLAAAAQFLPKLIREQRIQRELRHRATHDPLTGLLNRDGLEAAIERLVDGPEARRGVFFVDLDSFKQINDQHGHQEGDLVLIHAARHIKQQSRPTDLVARLGGDEFVLVTSPLADPHDLGPIGKRLLHALGQSLMTSSGQSIDVQASIGACLWVPGNDFEHVLARADELMYRAKAAQGGSVVIEEWQEANQNEVPLAVDNMLREGGPDLDILRILDLDDMTSWGLLVRVQRMLDPSLDPGFAGSVVMELAPHVTSPTMTIVWQLSSTIMSDRHCMEDLLAESRSAFGITRHALAIDAASASRGLLDCAEGLRAEQGTDLYLADFGSGAHEFELLHDLKPAGLILSRPIVQSLASPDPRVSAIKAASAIGQSLGMRTLAADVQQPEHFEILRELGCDFAAVTEATPGAGSQ